MRSLDFEDFAKIVHVANVKLSENGQLASFVVVRPDMERNRYNYEIWIYDLKRRKQVATISSEAKDYGQEWVNSDSIIFLSRRGFKEDEKGNAVYHYSLRGEPREILKHSKGISTAKPTSKKNVAFTATWVNGEQDDDYVVIEDLPVWIDGSGYTDRQYTHLYYGDINSGNYEQITKGKFNVVSFAPANKAEKVALSVVTDWRKPLNTEVWVINLKDPSDVYKAITGNYNFTVNWSPDDKYLILHGFDARKGLSAHMHVWITESDTQSEPINLTEKLGLNTYPAISSDVRGPYRAPYQPIMAEDKWIYFLVNNAGASNIYRVNLNGEIEKVTEGKHAIYEFTVSKKGDKIIYVKVTPRNLPDIYMYNWENEERLTCFNCWFENNIKIAESVHTRFKASDGEEIDGWVIKPETKENEKVPGVLFIHGGPKGAYGYAVNFMHQLLVSKGYAVMYCNPRGSDGYTEKFADIRGHYGERDYQDVMEFVEHVLRENKDIDAEKLAVTGISYGGYMTNWIITKTDKFKAAITENGIADWAIDYYTSDIGYYFDPDQIGGTPWENFENYKKQSPAWNLDNVKTPLLIIHSANDYRCYIEQALIMHVGLKTRNKETKLVIFKKGSHGHSILEKPKHRLKRYKIIHQYLQEKLKKQY